MLLCGWLVGDLPFLLFNPCLETSEYMAWSSGVSCEGVDVELIYFCPQLGKENLCACSTGDGAI